MKKGNIVDFLTYREATLDTSTLQKEISQELETAIQMLIYRLRELGPLSS